MTRLLLTIALCLLCAAPTLSQTVITVGPVPLGAKVQYEPGANVTTVAEAASFEARLTKNGAPLTAASASNGGLACAPSSLGITCEWVLTQSNLDALNMVGRHELTLRVYRADVGESQASLPFSLTSRAAAPLNLRLMP
jgi:hypothetical protein